MWLSGWRLCGCTGRLGVIISLRLESDRDGENVSVAWRGVWSGILAGETRTDNSKSEIQGFFPFGKLRVRMTT
jgi:hypothetical protein